MRKTRVVVGMSGGVAQSRAAAFAFAKFPVFGYRLDVKATAPKLSKAAGHQAWERLRQAGKDPWPQLSAKQVLDTLRGPIELSLKKPHAHRH